MIQVLSERKFSAERHRPTIEDLLRSLAYSGVMVWAVLFMVFPPVAYTDTLQVWTRIAWVGACFVGALIALIGSLTRLDLKVEFPGMCIMLIGPLLYTVAQAWLTIWPPEGTDPNARVALIAYASLPVLFALPRMVSLYSETQRAKHLEREKIRAVAQLTEEGF